VVGGAGVLALGIGSYFGLHAISKNHQADDRCPGDGSTCADPRGAELSQQANDAAGLSNAFIVSGVALAAAGVVLYFTAPKPSATELAMHADGRSVRVSLGGAL
jgi:serine/threonine-protein kinase